MAVCGLRSGLAIPFRRSVLSLRVSELAWARFALPILSPSPREAHRVAGIDIDDVAGRLCRQVGGEKVRGLGNVFRQDVELQEAPLAIVLLEFVRIELVGGGTLLAP